MLPDSSVAMSVYLLLGLQLLVVLVMLPLCQGETEVLVTTLAGGGGDTWSGSNDGVGTVALFNGPHGIALSESGEYALVVSDYEA